MSDEEREELRHKLKRIGDAQANIRKQIEPFEQTIRMLQEMADETIEAAGLTEDPETCEGCERLLIPGDLVHTTSDGPVFCERCAPTYGDILREYQQAEEADLQLWLDDDRTKAEIIASVAAQDPNQKAVHPL
jgi:hypothetical protein